MNDQEKLSLYRAVIVTLCKQQGGEFVVLNQAHEGGTLMNKIEGDNIRFRWVQDSLSH